jgi:hypothetical protein
MQMHFFSAEDSGLYRNPNSGYDQSPIDNPTAIAE